MTKAIHEYSSIGDNFEDVTDSDLEIESLKREPDSVIEDFIVSASYTKDVSKKGTEHLSKIWRINLENTEITLDVNSKRCARMDNPSLV